MEDDKLPKKTTAGTDAEASASTAAASSTGTSTDTSTDTSAATAAEPVAEPDPKQVRADALLEEVRRVNPGAEALTPCDLPAVTAAAEGLEAFMTRLRDDAALAFDMLADHAAVDWIADNRFELVYRLYSTKHGHDLVVSVSVPRDNPVAPSLTRVWTIAQWQEREVYDLFGVTYSGHPDLRRLFLEDDWVGHPLRKDYKDDFMLENP